MKIDLNDTDALSFYGKLEHADIVSPSQAEVEVIKSFTDQEYGLMLPWAKTHNKVRIREGEVSLWGGVNGHGKSLLLGQIAAWTCAQEPWCIASLEIPFVKSLNRIVRQASGGHHPSNEWIGRFVNWADRKLWFYDRLDSVPHEAMLGVICYSAKELGVKHFVIDSLVKCSIGREDYDRQMRFVEALSTIAKQFDMHVHLVHHMRKGQTEDHIPTKFDFRGAGEITDLADNVFITHRNKKKERQIKGASEEARKKLEQQPDQFLVCAKQRYGDWEGVMGLWFDHDSLQYTPTDEAKPMPYFAEEHFEEEY